MLPVVLLCGRIPCTWQAYGSFPYSNDTPTNAIKWNPHHNRRMILASARKDLVLVWNLENNSDSKVNTSEQTGHLTIDYRVVLCLTLIGYDTDLNSSG